MGMANPRPPRAPSLRAAGLLLLACGVASATILASIGPWAGPSAPGGSSDVRRAASLSGPDSPGDVLSLSIAAAPGAICVGGLTSCAAGSAAARVTLSATAAPGASDSYPSVQVVFVLETTPYDGVYDPTAPGGESGYDPCASPAFSGRTLCEESDGVPVFVANAGTIAGRIQSANPNSQVSFGLIDFASDGSGPWDDGDGSAYHVDVGGFVPASQFGAVVSSTFQATQLGGGWTYPDSDLRDNFLDSPVITALYGALEGAGLGWSSSAHHVIVWVGSTAPRDPNFSENYCVSPHVLSTVENGTSCLSSPCEPSYDFGGMRSPVCLGWTSGTDGNTSASIAALARGAPSCAGSLGSECTIDVVDLPTTSTDPSSPGWPNRTSTVPDDRSIIRTDVAHVIAAGCAIAAATGGSWAGPLGSSCSNGQTGGLPFPTSGSSTDPNQRDPALVSAMAGISFGPFRPSPSDLGADLPMFAFVPASGIALAPSLQATAACLHNGTPVVGCVTAPTRIEVGGTTGLAWNWSTDPSQNALAAGDTWTASFDVVATGPPSSAQPVDACATAACLTSDSGPVDGWFTRAHFLLPSNSTVISDSFPLVTIRTESIGSAAPPGVSSPPGSLGTPPAPVVPAPVALPGVQPAGPGPSVSIPNLSVQAIAAGVLAAGFTGMVVRQRSLRMPLANRAGAGGPGRPRSTADRRYQPPP